MGKSSENYLDFETTDEIGVPEKLIDQVIGQEKGVEVIKKAAKQRRNVFLIGKPGTGKSMLGRALSELLPKEDLTDILVFPNPQDENSPKIKEVGAGKGKEIVSQSKIGIQKGGGRKTMLIFLGMFLAFSLISYLVDWFAGQETNAILQAADRISGTIFMVSMFLIFMIFYASYKIGKQRGMTQKDMGSKLLVNNSDQEKAPFVEATGIHAGALLGDVKHDPFQCFSPKNSLFVLKDNNSYRTSIKNLVEGVLEDSGEVKESQGDKATFVDNNLKVMGEKGGEAVPVDVLSVNKHKNEGEMIKITTEKGRELIVTPEHKVFQDKNGKKLTEARKLESGEDIFLRSDTILGRWDIIKTYSEEEVKSARGYYDFLELKKKHPGWGYKRLANALDLKYGQVRWWYTGESKPRSIKTVEWLKEKGLIPLKINNEKLPLIAKVLGATFGDGGIFKNLNGIFLSSSEKEALEDFEEDLEEIFGKEIKESSFLREGGEYGSSFNKLNTNRKVIRFFLALGAPRGKKSKTDFKIPEWLRLDQKAEDNFFGALFGSEIGIPKVHAEGNRLDNMSFGLRIPKKRKENRLRYLKRIKEYLSREGIESRIRVDEEENNKLLMRLMLSTKLENVVKFKNKVKILYCRYKSRKLSDTIKKFKRIKSRRYEELSREYGHERAMSLLNLSPSILGEIE